MMIIPKIQRRFFFLSFFLSFFFFGVRFKQLGMY